MRVIAKSSLRKFWEQSSYILNILESWYEETIKASWLTPQDVKNQYGNASICGNNRVVFNIGGNKYRLVFEIQYQAGRVILFISSNKYS